MNLVFLLEEPSMQLCLESLLPKILPESVSFICIKHQGKSDLEKSIPKKLRGWNIPDSKFIIVRDQDSGDCVTIKNNLIQLCQRAGKNADLIRIACRELESWFLGDLAAVEKAFHKNGLSRLQAKNKFRNPDRLGSPSRELLTLIPQYQKKSGAKKIAPHLSIQNNKSHSFNVFVSGVVRISGQ